MYVDIPVTVMNKINNAAQEMINSGGGDQMPSMANIFSLGNQIVNDMSPDDLNKITSSVMQNASGIQNMCTTMLGGGNTDNESGVFNPFAILKMFMK